MRVSERQILRSLVLASFEDFCKEMWSQVIQDKVVWNWHMTFICDELQKVAERIFAGLPKLYDLVVNVSPGSSKSTIASIMFPAYCWARMPGFKYIGASYSYDLALDLSRKCRDVIKSELYRALFPEIEFREDQDTKGYFTNTKGGQRFAAGAGGTVQGMHGHCIGIDDPLNPKEAASDADMLSVSNWIKEQLSGRKVDRNIAPMILIMQRLHQDDPTAYFLKKKRVRHICIPAEVTEDINPPEIRRFYRDGLMDPIRLPREILDETKEDFGPYAYAGQFLQSPVPQSGGMFDTSRVKYGLPDNLRRVVRYWDKAGTAHKTKKGRGAWTVGVKMGVDNDNRLFILDVVRVRMDSYDREKLIKNTAVADGTKVKIIVEQEGGSGGKESAEGTVRRLMGYSITVDSPKGDKEVRADPFSVQVNGGNLTLVPGPWNEAYIEEMKFFPFSTTKDQIDASAGAFAALAVRQRRRVGAMPTRAEIGNKDGKTRAGVHWI